jgi:gliding motility-associated-like protein
VNDGVCTFPGLGSNTLKETVNPVPQIRITGDTVLFRGGTSQLDAMVGNISSGLSYAWTPAGSLSNPVIADPVAAPPKTTTYTVDVTTDNGCTAEKSVVVHLITNIVPPNAFSPNGDGNNDVFRIQYELDISAVHFYVYNRWGQLLFADEGTHQGWDGRFNGSPQPTGAYAWVFQYKDREGNRQTLKGIVELVR